MEIHTLCQCFLQAAIISHKKEAALTTFRETRDMYNRITQEVEQKRETVKVAGGGEVLKGEDVSVEGRWRGRGPQGGRCKCWRSREGARSSRGKM